jgi:hypothetical protein
MKKALMIVALLALLVLVVGCAPVVETGYGDDMLEEEVEEESIDTEEVEDSDNIVDSDEELELEESNIEIFDDEDNLEEVI